MLKYTEFDRQKVRDLLDEHNAAVERDERIIGHSHEAIARNNQEIERLREIMSDSERAIFDELLDSEMRVDERKVREALIIARHESREAQASLKSEQDQDLKEAENGAKITYYLVFGVLGVLLLLFLFR
ncbi:hypothetical protein LOY54_17455 [Pseudomonas sp. B21-032]|uniref:hypothetical protein n=1 Tax=Pseudomonas sp. B21-032 TaxID=2895483 RepID=UPI00215F0793|nr:hypothetical protein [Pseudomonas sp. B21-032]UVL59825.1 hypothetical protein LOY54_17455 [Pseudomonas sp. B21-032]